MMREGCLSLVWTSAPQLLSSSGLSLQLSLHQSAGHAAAKTNKDHTTLWPDWERVQLFDSFGGIEEQEEAWTALV